MPASRTAALVVSAAVAAVPGTAVAHSTVIGTEPAEGATVRTAPSTLTIRFNEPVRTEFTYARLTGPGGTASEPKAQVKGSDVLVQVPRPLANGSYTLAYRVASADTHPVSGVLHFTVAAPGGAVPSTSSGPSMTPLTSPSTTASGPSGAPAPSASGEQGKGSSGGPSQGFWFLVFGLGLLAAAAGWFAGRAVRRR